MSPETLIETPETISDARCRPKTPCVSTSGATGAFCTKKYIVDLHDRIKYTIPMSIQLDIAAAMYSVAEAADVAGVPRKFLDLWVSQKKIQPTRWVSTKRPKSAKSRGRPMFSVRVIFTVRLMRVLHSLGLTYLDAAVVAKGTEKGKVSESEAFLISTDGDWMTACAKSIHTVPIHVHAYAAQFNEKWSVEVHLGSSPAAPSFGLQTPHIFIPASDIFFAVYRDCAKLLGHVVQWNDLLTAGSNFSSASPSTKRRLLSN